MHASALGMRHWRDARLHVHDYIALAPGTTSAAPAARSVRSLGTPGA